eukprot:285595-Amorphochlora_amoeboformis.AAC.1
MEGHTRQEERESRHSRTPDTAMRNLGTQSVRYAIYPVVRYTKFANGFWLTLEGIIGSAHAQYRSSSPVDMDPNGQNPLSCSHLGIGVCWP